MAGVESARTILNGLVFLASEADRAGLPIVTRRIARVIDEVATWVDDNATERSSAIPTPTSPPKVQPREH
jgi:hypothetical protein